MKHIDHPARTETSRILAEHGATLVRSKKHEVWRLPGGQTFVRSSTPSDGNGELNNLADLRRVLGISDPSRGAPGERRERKLRGEAPQQKPRAIGATINGAFQEKLLASGVVADSLALKNARLEAKLAAVRHELQLVVAANNRNNGQRLWLLRHRCWWCRLRPRLARWMAAVLRARGKLDRRSNDG